jgi:hypothetical protein
MRIAYLLCHSIDGGNSVGSDVNGHRTGIDNTEVLGTIDLHLVVNNTTKLTGCHGSSANRVPDGDSPLPAEVIPLLKGLVILRGLVGALDVVLGGLGFHHDRAHEAGPLSADLPVKAELVVSRVNQWVCEGVSRVDVYVSGRVGAENEGNDVDVAASGDGWVVTSSDATLGDHREFDLGNFAFSEVATIDGKVLLADGREVCSCKFLVEFLEKVGDVECLREGLEREEAEGSWAGIVNTSPVFLVLFPGSLVTFGAVAVDV